MLGPMAPTFWENVMLADLLISLGQVLTCTGQGVAALESTNANVVAQTQHLQSANDVLCQELEVLRKHAANLSARCKQLESEREQLQLANANAPEPQAELTNVQSPADVDTESKFPSIISVAGEMAKEFGQHQSQSLEGENHGS